MQVGSRRPGHLHAGALALALAVAIVAGASCGGGSVSSARAVEGFNRVAAARGVKLMCPDEVDTSAKEIDCTLQGIKTGKTTPVKMKSIDKEDEFVDAADGTEFNKAVQSVTQP